MRFLLPDGSWEFLKTRRVQRVVGINTLLEQLFGYGPDNIFAELCPREFTGGRPHELSAPQLWRVPLLAGLKSTRSLNLQSGWSLSAFMNLRAQQSPHRFESSR